MSKLRRCLTFVASCLLTTNLLAAPDSEGPAIKIASFKDQYYVAALAFNRDDSKLAVNFMVAGDAVRVWDWRNHHVQSLPTGASAGDGQSFAVSPDGTLLATGHARLRQFGEEVTRIWNFTTGAVLHDITAGNRENYGQRVAISSDGQLLIRAQVIRIDSLEDNLFAYRTDTGALAWSLRTAPFEPYAIAISPDNKFVALAGDATAPGIHPHPENPPAEIEIEILNLSTRNVVRTIREPALDGWATTLAWSPDGRQIAAGHNANGIEDIGDALRIYDATTGTPLKVIQAKSSATTGLAYSPDGRFLIAGSIGNSIRIMEGHTYQLLQTIPGDARALAISKDNQYLATARGSDVSIWRLNGGAHILPQADAVAVAQKADQDLPFLFPEVQDRTVPTIKSLPMEDQLVLDVRSAQISAQGPVSIKLEIHVLDLTRHVELVWEPSPNIDMHPSEFGCLSGYTCTMRASWASGAHELLLAVKDGLYLIGASGQERKTDLQMPGIAVAYSAADNFAISDDGKTIAFWVHARDIGDRSHDPADKEWLPGDGRLYDELMHERISGSKPISVANDIPPLGVTPAWSPDGAHIAYQGHGPNGSGLVVADIGNGDTVSSRIVTLLGGLEVQEIRWSPDGKRIGIVSKTREGPNQLQHFRLLMVNADGSDLSPIQVGKDDIDVSSFDWAPSGDS